MLKVLLKIVLVLLVLVTPIYMVACTSMGSNPDGDRMSRIEKSPQYNVALEKFENEKETPLFTGKRTRWEIFVDFFTNSNERRPRTALPETPVHLNDLTTKSKEARFIWFGHSTILLEMDEKRILIDPVFSKYASPIPGVAKRFQPPVIKLEEIKDIDVVLISHDHYDHLDHKTISWLKNRNIHYVVPLGVGAHLEYWGIQKNRITELDWWEGATLQGLSFVATPSQHFSGRGMFNENSTLWASWVIQGKEQRIFFGGDSGYSDHYKKIGDKLGPFDLAFLENGAYNLSWKFMHQLPEEGVQANIDLNSKAMVPIHWGMFDLSVHSWYEPIERVTKAARQKGVTIVAPKLGQLISTKREFVQEEWWRPIINWVKS